MDPNACLKRIEDAVSDRDWEEFHDAHRDLEEWLDKGGFKPNLYSERMMALINQLAEFAQDLVKERHGTVQ